MENNVLEFECVGLNNGGKFPIENTGRGKDISPEFIIQNLSTNAVTLMIMKSLTVPFVESRCPLERIRFPQMCQKTAYDFVFLQMISVLTV